MWWTTRAAATAAVLGAALVTAAVHGHAPATTTPSPAALTAPVTYQPPMVALPTPAAHVRLVSGAAERPVTKATPRTTHATRKPAPARRLHTATSVKPHVRHHADSMPTYAAALNSAVARIPTYRAGTVRWVVSRAYAFWGTADWYHGVLYVSPDVPRSKLYDVAVHEWSHELSVLDYAGDVATATRAMNAWFGGTDLVGAERAADCMSILQGATWTHYTTCTNAHWRAGARLLVSGQPL